MRARLATTFQSLRIPNYRLFLSGQLIKLVGSWMQVTAQDWLVLKLTNNSAYALGVVTALQFTPVLLLTLYGGKLADRYDKRKLIIGANCVHSVLALGLGLLVFTDRVTLHWVFLVAFLMGVVNAIEPPVRQAFVSEMVPRELLPNALSLSAATFNTARILGPAAAGLAIAWVDLPPVFLTNTLTYLAPAVMMLRMRRDQLHLEPRREEADTRIREAVRYVWGKPDLLMPILLLLVVGLVGFNFNLTLPVLAKNEFGRGPEQFGLLTTAVAVGALGGAFAGSGRRSRPSVYVVLGAAIGFGALELITGLSTSFTLTLILLVPTGFFMIYFAQATNQRIQHGTDAAHRGRVMAMFILVFMGTTPIGAPAIGWLSQEFGPRVAVWGGGIATMLAAGTVLAYQLRRSGARIRLQWAPMPRFTVVQPGFVQPAETTVPG